MFSLSSLGLYDFFVFVALVLLALAAAAFGPAERFALRCPRMLGLTSVCICRRDMASRTLLLEWMAIMVS